MKLFATARPDVKHGAAQGREQRCEFRRHLSGHGFTICEPESRECLVSESGKIEQDGELPLDEEDFKDSQNMICPGD
jgi:hypothetical protein